MCREHDAGGAGSGAEGGRESFKGVGSKALVSGLGWPYGVDRRKCGRGEEAWWEEFLNRSGDCLCSIHTFDLL